MGKYLNGKRLQNELFARTEGYANEVRKIYNNALSEIIELVKGTELEDGKPFSFADYGYSDVVTPILRNMYSRTYQTIKKGVTGEWKHSNEQCDELVKSIFGAKSIEDNHFARYFQRNQDAMDAFLERKTGKEGLNLSQKVWKYTGAYKEELEDTIELALGEGKGANRLAPTIKKYLQEPDRWYKRFRVKIGEDENGNPIYGRKWKRRIWDKDSDSYKWIDSEPKNYHPGKGVYRSSARNAQRLARTETNIAYREADHERWEQLDFVVGIEIKLSNNHPDPDICNDLAGVYPKDFKWNGWHPNCRCYAEPKLAKQEEMDKMLEAILEGQDPGTVEVEREKEMPDNFTTWIRENKDRYEGAKQAGTLSYFLKDNQELIEQIINPLTPEQKHHKELVKKYGQEAVDNLYSAFDSFKQKISVGNLQHQIKKLSFEIDYVEQHPKFSTSMEMKKMLEEELQKVLNEQARQMAIIDAQSVLGYKSKSKNLNVILLKLEEAINTGKSASEIRTLTSQAKAKIIEIDKARLSKLSKSATGDFSTIDIYATSEEKLELARLKDVYDKKMSLYQSQWNSEVNSAYQEYAKYQNELALKYHSKQGKIKKLNGETDELAKQCLKEYRDAPFNFEACSPVGGKWETRSSELYDMQKFSNQTGIPVEELALINRYTYGSKWCNTYGYGIKTGGYVNDYGGLCQKYYPATNAVLEKMPRYNGTVFSGIKFDSATLKDYVSKMQDCLKNGKEYTNSAFLSSSTDIETTTIFGDNLMLVIQSKTGANVKPISHYKGEDEIVFRAGSKFKVKKVYQETTRKYGFGKGWVVELEEI